MGNGEVVSYKRAHLVDPWRSECFFLTDGTDVCLLLYLTQPPRVPYTPDDYDLLPVVLENDRVVGWGWSYVRRKTDRYRVSVPKEQR